MSSETKFLYYRESLWQSIASDTLSCVSLIALFWFNYNFIGGNNFIDAFILIAVFSLISGRYSKNRIVFTSKEDLKKFVDGL